MLITIALFVCAIFIRCLFKRILKENEGYLKENRMADEVKNYQEPARSSSESDNFEKIDNVNGSNGENSDPNFKVGDESSDPELEDGPAHEGRDSFSIIPPSNIRRVLTPAQQLALAEKRSTLRFRTPRERSRGHSY